MIQKSNKKKKSIKPYVMGIAVVLILIVAPIGSFLFLKNGIEYRIESLEQLEPKTISSQLDGVIRLKAPFNGNARLIHIPGELPAKELDLLLKMDDKIVDRQRFEIISLMDGPADIGDNKVEFIPSNHNVSFQEQFVLIDTSNVIRGAYAFQEDLDKELIRHLSVVVPMPTKKTIKLEREKID